MARMRHPQGAYAWNKRELDAAGDAPALLGLFEPDHMQFDHDRNKGPDGEPSLAEMTTAAIRTLSRNPDGYVLMVEGGRIDHANHYGNAFRALDETIALSDAVRAAVEATSPEDTLILVTADHSHTLNFVGYPVRGNPMLGKVRGVGGEDGNRDDYARDLNGLPYTTLNYANGPGYWRERQQCAGSGPKKFLHEPSSYEPPPTGRPDLTKVDTEDPGLPAGSNDSLESRNPWRRRRRHLGARPRQRCGARHRGAKHDLPLHRAGHTEIARAPVRGEDLQGEGVPVELPKPSDFEKKYTA